MDDDEFEIELPPPDVVPHSEITSAVADLLKAHVGEQVIVHWPGEAIEGPDGDLVAMTERRTVTATLARLHIPHEENRDDDRTD
jgi:hypothetical protein